MVVLTGLLLVVKVCQHIISPEKWNQCGIGEASETHQIVATAQLWDDYGKIPVQSYVLAMT